MGRHDLWSSRFSAALMIFILGCAAPYYAVASPTDFVTLTPIHAEGSSTDITGYAATASFRFQTLATVNTTGGDKYQFVSYYDNNQKLAVGRRKMLLTGWSDWYLRPTEFTSYNINDGHNVGSIGIDGDGYMHISWGMHINNMLYTRSSASATNDTAFTLVGDTVGNSAALGAEFASLNTQITYPQFYNIPGSGDLFFVYRTITSGDGDMQLWRWNNTTNAWQTVHAQNRPGSWIDGNYSGDGLPTVNAYINGITFDTQGNMHTTWTWRTGSDSPTPYKDYQSNHNIMYAWSPNQGVDWYRADNTIYQRSGVHAIDESNAPPVITLPEGSSLMNQTSMSSGPDDTVYLASWWAPNAASGDHLRQYMLGWYEGDTWHVSQITNRNPENTSGGVSQRVAESQLSTYRMMRPVVAVDEDNRVIVAFSDWQRGQKLSLAISKSPTRDDWQIFDLTTTSMGGEPSIDLSRWQSDGILSMIYQVQGTLPSVISVLEWDGRKYFITTSLWDWSGGNSAGNWSTAANWSEDAHSVYRAPNGEGYRVRFGNQATANNVVDITSADRTVGSIIFTSSTGTTIQSTSGYSLILDNLDGNNSTIEVAGTHTIAAQVLLSNDVDVSGTGTLTFSGGISGPHGMNILSGNINAANIYLDRLSIASGATLAIQGSASGPLGTDFSPIPEPATWTLLTMGALCALGYRRWRIFR